MECVKRAIRAQGFRGTDSDGAVACCGGVLEASGFGPHRVERGVGQDEERAVVRASKDEIDGTLGNVDVADALAVRSEDLHLTGREIDVACLVLSDAFAAGVGEELHI